jgi:hypothetical protein
MIHQTYPSKIIDGNFTILKFGGNFSIKYNHKEFRQMVILHCLSMFIVLATLIGDFIYLVYKFSQYDSVRVLLLEFVPDVIFAIMILWIVSYMMYMLSKKVSPPCTLQLYQLLYYYKNKNRSRNTSGVITSCKYDECIIRFKNKYDENVFIKIPNPFITLDIDNRSKKYKYEINFGFEHPNSVIIIKK